MPRRSGRGKGHLAAARRHRAKKGGCPAENFSGLGETRGLLHGVNGHNHWPKSKALQHRTAILNLNVVISRIQ
jgi:hypothetical protein